MLGLGLIFQLIALVASLFLRSQLNSYFILLSVVAVVANTETLRFLTGAIVCGFPLGKSASGRVGI